MNNLTIGGKPKQSCDSCVHRVDPPPILADKMPDALICCAYGIEDREQAITRLNVYDKCACYEKGVIDVDFDVVS